MTRHADNEPDCHEAAGAAFDLLIEARPRDIGDFTVRRALPSPKRRLVGPFVFFDQMGPAVLPVGRGMDVRPHPHIELATLTYLFEGEIDHRDSLGSFQTIRPGDVNWMLAGKGIVHSERSPAEARARGVRIHGIQCWVALPLEHERAEPRFEHHPASTIPRMVRQGVVMEVIAGEAYGERSPVGVMSPTLYVHARLERDAELRIDEHHEERAIYVVEGSVACGPRTIPAGTMAVLRPGAEVTIRATDGARVMLLGGAKLDGPRFIEWNFVSSAKERIEEAKRAWVEDRFPRVPGDEKERIPLPGT